MNKFFGTLTAKNKIFVIGLSNVIANIDVRLVDQYFTNVINILSPNLIQKKRMVGVIRDEVISKFLLQFGESERAQKRIIIDQYFTKHYLNRLVDNSTGFEVADLTHIWINDFNTLINQIDFSRPDINPENNVNSENHSKRSVISSEMLNLPNIAGHDAVKQLLYEVIVWPRVHSDLYKAYRIQPTVGILFYGPPGTGIFIANHDNT